MVLAPPRRGFGVAARAVGHADGLSSACRSAGVLLAAIFSVSLPTRISPRARRSGRTAPPSPLDSGGVGAACVSPQGGGAPASCSTCARGDGVFGETSQGSRAVPRVLLAARLRRDTRTKARQGRTPHVAVSCSLEASVDSGTPGGLHPPTCQLP